MERSSGAENREQISRYQVLLSKSGGQIQTSVTALQNLESQIDRNLEVEKSPKGEKVSFLKLRRGTK